MKIYKILYLLPIFIMAGCDDHFPYSYYGDLYSPASKGYYLYLAKTSLEFSGESSQDEMNVQAEDTPWKFSGMASWLTLNPISGSKDAIVTVAATENPSGDNVRTSVFKLEATEMDVEKSFNISVTQKASSPYVTLSSSEYTFGASQSSQKFEVSSNVGWSISGGTTWLNISVASDSLSFIVTANENTTSSSRSATLYFYSNSSKRLNSLGIVQVAPSSPTSSPETLVFNQPGGTFSLSITSEVSWTASVDVSWLEVTPQSGSAGTTRLNIAATANTTAKERMGHLALYIGGKEMATIEVRQKGLYVETEPESLTFSAQSESKNLHISSNVAWSVFSKPEWVNLPDTTSGNGYGILTLQVEDYWGSLDRSGVLTLGASGTDLVTSVPITQKGRFFDNLTSLLTFDASAGSESITVSTDGKWTAKVTEEATSWLSITPISGTGNGTIQISVTENANDEERTGEVQVTVGSTTKSVGIVQNGKYFTVSPASFAMLPSTGGSHTIHIASDDSWTANTSSSWMTLSRNSGTGNVDVTLTAPDHPSVTARDDTTTFTPTYAQPVRVITRQSGRFLTVDVTSIRFFARGGTSDPVQVSTDATFTLATSDSWLSIQRQNNAFTVTATENTTDARREGKVVITMTGLPEGEEYTLEIPVVQRINSSGVEVEPYNTDQQWELNGNGMTIRVIGFSTDKNWDDTSSNGLNIKVKTFSEDKKWD